MRHLYDVDHRDMKRGIILKLFGTQMSQIIRVQNYDDIIQYLHKLVKLVNVYSITENSGNYLSLKYKCFIINAAEKLSMGAREIISPLLLCTVVILAMYQTTLAFCQHEL